MAAAEAVFIAGLYGLPRPVSPQVRGKAVIPRKAAFCYDFKRAKLLDKALEAVRQLPSESQDEIALVMLRLAANDGEAEAIDPAHLPAVLKGLAQSKSRAFAEDADVEAAIRRFDR